MRRAALALGLLALLAGCGGGSPRDVTVIVQPTLPRALATSWRAQADAVEAALQSGDGCAAQAKAASLDRAVIAAVNAHRVPARFQETLVSAVNDLAGRISCTPAPAPAPAPRGHGHPGPKPHPKPPHPKPPHGPHGPHGKGKK